MSMFAKKALYHFMIGAFIVGGIAFTTMNVTYACCGGGYYGDHGYYNNYR